MINNNSNYHNRVFKILDKMLLDTYRLIMYLLVNVVVANLKNSKMFNIVTNNTILNNNKQIKKNKFQILQKKCRLKFKMSKNNQRLKHEIHFKDLISNKLII